MLDAPESQGEPACWFTQRLVLVRGLFNLEIVVGRVILCPLTGIVRLKYDTTRVVISVLDDCKICAINLFKITQNFEDLLAKFGAGNGMQKNR